MMVGREAMVVRQREEDGVIDAGEWVDEREGEGTSIIDRRRAVQRDGKVAVNAQIETADGRVPWFNSAQFSSAQWSELTWPPRLGFAFKGKWNRRAVCTLCCRTTVCSASDGWISPGRNERIRVSLIEDLTRGRTPLFKLLTQLSSPPLPVLLTTSFSAT